MKYIALLHDQKYKVEVDQKDGKICVQLNGKPVNADFVKLAQGIDYSLLINNTSYQLSIEHKEGIYQVYLGGYMYSVSVQSEREKQMDVMTTGKVSRAGVKEIKAPMPGLVVEVEVKEGDTVTKGSGLVIVEAMKMENEMKSPVDGVVQEVRVQKRDTVEKEQILIVIE